MAQNRKSPLDATPSTPESHSDQTSHKPPTGQVLTGLNFLDTISDFSDMVDLYTKYDQIAHGEPPIGKEGSQKKCRNCS